MSEQRLNIKFVQEVEKYPCLYNYLLAEYSRKDITEAAWNNVGKKMNMSGTACKEKWKNLRAVFVRHIKPAPSGSGAKRKKYYLADVMQFILPYVKIAIPLQSGNVPECIMIKSEDTTDTFISEEDNEASNLPPSPTEYHPNDRLFQDPPSPTEYHPNDRLYQDPPSPTEYQPNDRLFQENTNITEKKLSPVEMPQPTTSSIPQSRAVKRQKPLDEVDETFVSSFKEWQGAEVDTRKMFLLSLMDEVASMSDQQWRLFKRRALNVIDEIMTPTKT